LVEFDERENLKMSAVRDYAIAHCAALDFFVVVGSRATSCANDSFVRAGSIQELVSKLDARVIWTSTDGFGTPPFHSGSWIFETRSFVEFHATILPDGYISELSWQTVIKRAEDNSLPTLPYIGNTIDKAAAAICDVARRMILGMKDLNPKGAAQSGWTVNLQSEYDCQNLLFTVLKPWLGSVGREEIAIRYDEQAKVADFNLFNSQLVIELKYIDTEQKKREVIKTLSGLSEFYLRHANIRVLLILVYVKHGVSVDGNRWQVDYSYVTHSPKVITQVIEVP
jgi:REase_DpnII-MboI